MLLGPPCGHSQSNCWGIGCARKPAKGPWSFLQFIQNWKKNEKEMFHDSFMTSPSDQASSAHSASHAEVAQQRCLQSRRCHRPRSWSLSTRAQDMETTLSTLSWTWKLIALWTAAAQTQPFLLTGTQRKDQALDHSLHHSDAPVKFCKQVTYESYESEVLLLSSQMCIRCLRHLAYIFCTVMTQPTLAKLHTQMQGLTEFQLDR